MATLQITASPAAVSSTTSTVSYTYDCSGTFGDEWFNNSYVQAGQNALYTGGKLDLYNHSCSGTEAAIALSKESFSTTGVWTVEFDWWPVPGSGWWDDDLTDAKNIVQFCETSVAYETDAWGYHRLVDTVHTDVHLRSSKSNKINVSENQYDFTYGTSHAVKIELDFNTYIIKLWMDGGFIGSGTLSSSLGSEFKLHYYFHSYNYTADQYYDNIDLTQEKTTNSLVTVNLTAASSAVSDTNIPIPTIKNFLQSNCIATSFTDDVTSNINHLLTANSQGVSSTSDAISEILGFKELSASSNAISQTSDAYSKALHPVAASSVATSSATSAAPKTTLKVFTESLGVSSTATATGKATVPLQSACHGTTNTATAGSKVKCNLLADGSTDSATATVESKIKVPLSISSSATSQTSGIAGMVTSAIIVSCDAVTGTSTATILIRNSLLANAYAQSGVIAVQPEVTVNLTANRHAASWASNAEALTVFGLVANSGAISQTSEASSISSEKLSILASVDAVSWTSMPSARVANRFQVSPAAISQTSDIDGYSLNHLIAHPVAVSNTANARGVDRSILPDCKNVSFIREAPEWAFVKQAERLCQ